MKEGNPMNHDECRKAFEAWAKKIGTGIGVLNYEIWQAAWNSRTESKLVTREEIEKSIWDALEVEDDLRKYPDWKHFGTRPVSLGIVKIVDAVYALQLSAPQSPVVPTFSKPVTREEYVCPDCEGSPTGGQCNACNSTGSLIRISAPQSPFVPPTFDSDGNADRIYRDEEGFTTSFRNFPDQVEYIRSDLVSEQSPVVPGVEELRQKIFDAHEEWDGSESIDIATAEFVAKAIHAYLLATSGRQSREDQYRQALGDVVEVIDGAMENIGSTVKLIGEADTQENWRWVAEIQRQKFSETLGSLAGIRVTLEALATTSLKDPS